MSGINGMNTAQAMAAITANKEDLNLLILRYEHVKYPANVAASDDPRDHREVLKTGYLSIAAQIALRDDATELFAHLASVAPYSIDKDGLKQVHGFLKLKVGLQKPVFSADHYLDFERSEGVELELGHNGAAAVISAYRSQLAMLSNPTSSAHVAAAAAPLAGLALHRESALPGFAAVDESLAR